MTITTREELTLIVFQRCIGVCKLCARTYFRHVRYPWCTGGKDRESECVAWYQFVWLVAGSLDQTKVALCEPLSGILSNPTTFATIDLFYQRPRKIPITCTVYATSPSNGNRQTTTATRIELFALNVCNLCRQGSLEIIGDTSAAVALEIVFCLVSYLLPRLREIVFLVNGNGGGIKGKWMGC